MTPMSAREFQYIDLLSTDGQLSVEPDGWTSNHL